MGQKDGQSDRQTDGQCIIQAYRQEDRCPDRQAERMDRMAEKTDGQTHKQIDTYNHHITEKGGLGFVLLRSPRCASGKIAVRFLYNNFVQFLRMVGKMCSNFAARDMSHMK